MCTKSSRSCQGLLLRGAFLRDLLPGKHDIALRAGQRRQAPALFVGTCQGRVDAQVYFYVISKTADGTEQASALTANERRLQWPAAGTQRWSFSTRHAVSQKVFVNTKSSRSTEAPRRIKSTSTRKRLPEALR